MPITNAINPAVVQTELDDVFFQVFQQRVAPGMATADTPEIFRQVTLDNSAHIEEVASGGGGFWEVKGETVDVPQATPFVSNKITQVAVTFAKGITLSKEYFDDNMHNTWTRTVEKFARNALATRDREAFSLWNGAFTTTLTADGVSLVNAAHVTLDGPTVSNRVASNPPLTEASLNTAIVQLLELRDQEGVTMGEVPTDLLVPPAEFKNATEIVDSELVSDSANNAVNVYSSTYGIRIWQSTYLAASAGGSDTAWFLLSRNHAVTRYKREGVTTQLIDWSISSNDNYRYKGRYREVYGVTDYIGVVGSDGTGV